MPALIQSRRLRVFIGNDQQNWSTSVGEFLPGWDSLSESGLVTVSATLEILKVSTNPESIDPRDNPTRWRAGQPVLVEVANSAGAYVVHPMGRLFLLEEPDFPEPGGGIVLELGCRLAWHNTFEYDDEKTGITVGTPTNSATVASNLLQANEIGAGNISVSSWPYSLTIPKGKGPGGSFVQQAGELAYSNDYRYLYQNTSGTIVAGALDLVVANPVVTITLGTNDVAYQAIKTGTPPDQIKVAGTGTPSTTAENPFVDVVTIEGDRSQYAAFGLSCPGEGVIGRTVTTVSWTTSNDVVYHSTSTREESPPTATAKKLEDVAGMSPCTPRRWRTTTRTRQYDLTEEGRLTQEVEQIYQDRYTYIAGAFNPTVHELVSRATTTYTYAEEELVGKVERVEEQIQYLIDESTVGNDRSPDTTLREVKREIDTWAKVGDNRWKKTTVEKYPRKFRDNSPDIGDGQAIVGSNTTTTGTGENQPPRAELWDGGIITEDVEYQFTVNYTQPGGGSGRTRKQLYTLPYAFSEGQCQTMAYLHLKLVAGQHRAVAVEMPVTDALLTAPPLFAFDVVEPSGRRSHYRADSLAWEHSVDTCKAAATGILVGVTPAPTEGNPNPDPDPVTGTGVVAGGIPVEAGGLQVYATV